MPLLCTRFRGENESKSWLEVFEKFFWKKFIRNLVDSKKHLTFAPLSRLRNRETVKKGLWKVFWKKFIKNLVDSEKHLTFAPLSRLRNRKTRDAKKIWKLQRAQARKYRRSLRILSSKVFILSRKREFQSNTFEIRAKIYSKLFFLQWRVWSWLRMNASGRLNTCKSRGSINIACNVWWRPAHGCVTRMQPTCNRGITLRNWY